MAQRNQDRRPQRQIETKIILEYNPPTRFDDGSHVIEATAIVSRGKWMLDDEEISFFIGRNPHREGFNITNPEGRAFFAFFVPTGQKTAFIEAQIAGTTYRFGVLVHLDGSPGTAGPSKKLSQPSFRAEGDNGDYKISDCLVWEDGTIAKGVRVQFLISKLGKPGEDKYEVSDESGFVVHHLVFSESECDVTVQGPGFQQFVANLYGPPKQRPPIKLETPPTEKTGFWDVLRWGSERRKSWRRGE